MPAQPDFEQYARTLQQTMAAAIEEADALAALAAADREVAADVRITIREKLNALETLARQAAAKYVAEHRQQLQDTIRESVLTLVAAKLLNSGESVANIAELLDMPQDFVTNIVKH